MQNPALQQQSRDQLAPVIPPQRDASILDWLEGTGRLLDRDNVEAAFPDEEAEINDLMAGEDDSFDEEDDVVELDE